MIYMQNSDWNLFRLLHLRCTNTKKGMHKFNILCKKKINVRIKTLIVYMANLFPVSHFIINLFSLFFFSFSFREKKSEIRKFFLSILLFIFFFTKLNGIQVKEKENFVMNLKHFIFLIWFYIGKIGLPIL